MTERLMTPEEFEATPRTAEQRALYWQLRADLETTLGKLKNERQKRSARMAPVTPGNG